MLYLKPFSLIIAEAGGFEPPVRLPVRQFSKLLVSATHPNFLNDRSIFKMRCKCKPKFWSMQTFRDIFLLCTPILWHLLTKKQLIVALDGWGYPLLWHQLPLTKGTGTDGVMLLNVLHEVVAQVYVGALDDAVLQLV